MILRIVAGRMAGKLTKLELEFRLSLAKILVLLWSACIKCISFVCMYATSKNLGIWPHFMLVFPYVRYAKFVRCLSQLDVSLSVHPSQEICPPFVPFSSYSPVHWGDWILTLTFTKKICSFEIPIKILSHINTSVMNL